MDWVSGIVLAVVVGILLAAVVRGCLSETEPWGGKTVMGETKCTVGVTAGCLCETCKERYIESRLKQVELEIQERDRKAFLQEVDKSIEEMRKKHGLETVKPVPAPQAHAPYYSIHDLLKMR